MRSLSSDRLKRRAGRDARAHDAKRKFGDGGQGHALTIAAIEVELGHVAVDEKVGLGEEVEIAAPKGERKGTGELEASKFDGLELIAALSVVLDQFGGVLPGEGEETTWGKQAAWVDYSGPLADGSQWGHTVVDHKDNPLFPTYWHVRGYGLFTANPFGVHDFKKDENIDASWTIPGGDKRVFRFRLIVHPGRGADATPRIKELIDEFQA